MNSPTSPSRPRRRRRWPWVLAILFSPFVLLAVMAASYLTLNRDAAVLRGEVMAATDTKWDTKIQLSAGRLTFWLLRSGLAFVPDEKIGEAREALKSVKAVSVGVYQRSKTNTAAAWSREQLFNETDRTMRDRGWSRLVGVADKSENVLIYVPANSADVRRICLAVIKRRELVVVSASIDPDALAALIAHHAGNNLKRSLAAVRI
jgi:hypothetical protein